MKSVASEASRTSAPLPQQTQKLAKAPQPKVQPSPWDNEPKRDTGKAQRNVFAGALKGLQSAFSGVGQGKHLRALAKYQPDFGAKEVAVNLEILPMSHQNELLGMRSEPQIPDTDITEVDPDLADLPQDVQNHLLGR